MIKATTAMRTTTTATTSFDVVFITRKLVPDPIKHRIPAGMKKGTG
jgi:hypothetical protein